MPPRRGAPRLTFALSGDHLVHVSEVERGRACGCECPACGAALVAKKGSVVAHHFAHATGEDCPSAVETSLHLACKAVIEEEGRFTIPPLKLDVGAYAGDWTYTDAAEVKPAAVAVEQACGDVVPDVLLTVGGRRLAVEIRVTHAVDATKKAKLRSMGLSTVEVDMSRAPRELDRELIREHVIDNVDAKTWVFNARAEAAAEAVRESARALPTLHRGFALHADHCPIGARNYRGKSYANVIDDCCYCEYFVGRDPVLCLGHQRIGSYAAWRDWMAGQRRRSQ